MGNGPSLVQAIEEHRPDVSVVDVRMPPSHTNEGLRVAVEARKRVPCSRLNYHRKLLQLTTIPHEIAFAWALRDIGIWTSGWDYIPPSLNQVDELAPRYRIAHADRVRQMVEWHTAVPSQIIVHIIAIAAPCENATGCWPGQSTGRLDALDWNGTSSTS